MKKKGLKVTSQILTGMGLLTGLTTVPTNAVEMKTALVDMNVANVKATVYEKEGHFYTKLVADKDVSNVVARITTEKKAEFLIKRDTIKAGEEVVVELDMTAQVPTKKLPHTGVQREGFTVVNKAGGHEFKINVRYEVTTPKVKEQPEQPSKEPVPTKKAEEPKQADVDVKKVDDSKTKESEKPAYTFPSDIKDETTKKQDVAYRVVPAKTDETPKTEEVTKPVEESKTNETAVEKPTTPTEVKPSEKPVETVDVPKKEETKVVIEEKVEQPKKETAPQVATSREEQIRQAFINKVDQLRKVNALNALSVNVALNTSSQRRSADVPTRAIDGNLHGPHGSIQYETDAAKAAGYTKQILPNVAITGENGTPEEIAQRLFDILFKEIGNVSAYKYGHRNTLLDNTATEHGVGVTISNGQVYLVQHQNTSGHFNGTTPTPGKYLDGSTSI